MRPCPDRTEFLADPTGKWIAGERWLYFHRDEGLVGFTCWGSPTPADLEQLVMVLQVELGRAPHVSLVDVRGVTAIDPRGFLVLERYVRAHLKELSQAVTRLALVRPEGLMGAVTAGFFGIAPQPYPSKVFEDRRAALRWLGCPDVDAAAEELEEAEAQTTQSPTLLRDLRGWLTGHLEQAELSKAAKALKLSSRTLQRQLKAHRVSFNQELERVRLDEAKRLLEHTDAPLTEIAFDVGCASLPSFSRFFRRATGESPSAWRTSRRRSA